uniref:Fibronectin type-III domain-containing protein n=1 Tax=Acrobeloides nanus TaxID=290746 RepID=A0A914EJR1_9BILA
MPNSIVDALLAENISVELAHINQSFPSHYTSWIVHDLKPLNDYKCTIKAFDQYGRYGKESSPVIGRTLEPAPQKAPVIQRVKLQDDYNGYATYIDWSAIPLKIGSQEKDNKTKGKAKIKDRGYKIFIYISETAEKPIVLTLLESELQNPQKPSARIDGLKLMYYYTIK